MSCHLTFIGIVWLIVVLTLRLVTTFSSGDRYYSDDHLRCNTTQVNCEIWCNKAFKCISHYAFCFFQMVVAASPSAFYLQWADRKTSLNQRRRREHQPVHLTQRIKRDGLVAAYLLQLLVRATVECVLLYFQCQLFGTEVPEIYQCAVADAWIECTDRALVCSVDRPEQKTRHLLIMYTISAISLLLTVIDSAYLLLRTVCVRDSGEGTSGNDQPAGTRRGGDAAAEGEEEGLLLL